MIKNKIKYGGTLSLSEIKVHHKFAFILFVQWSPQQE